MKLYAQLTADDCVAARWLALRPRRSLRIVGYGVIALFILAIAWQLIEFASGSPLQSGFWWMIAAIAYLGLVFFVFMPWRIRRVYRQQKTLQAPFEVEFGDSAFAGQSKHGSFSIAWSDLHKWKLGQKCLLIYQSEAIMHVIPSRAFASSDQRDEAVRLLEAKMGEQKA